jgi:hypothetical protein
MEEDLRRGSKKGRWTAVSEMNTLRLMASETHIPIPTEFDEEPYDEQVRYIEALLGRMKQRLGGQLDPALVALVQRRYQRFLEDPDEGESLEQVRAEILAKYQ